LIVRVKAGKARTVVSGARLLRPGWGFG